MNITNKIKTMKAKTFNAITFTGNKEIGNNGFVKYKKIHSKPRHVDFINRKYPGWLFITFYDKETNEKEIIKKGTASAFPQKIPFFT